MITIHLCDIPFPYFLFPSADFWHSLFQIVHENDVKIAKSIKNDIIIPDPAPQVCVIIIYLIWLMSHSIILVIVRLTL
jgi:hypothetical protein